MIEFDLKMYRQIGSIKSKYKSEINNYINVVCLLYDKDIIYTAI